MNGEGDPRDDLGVTIEEILEGLTDGDSDHVSEDMLWSFAATDPGSFSPQQRDVFINHILDCRSCHKQFADFRQTARAEVPLSTKQFQSTVEGLRTEWQAKYLLLAVAFVAGANGLRIKREPRTRYRGSGATGQTLEVPQGKTIRIPIRFGDIGFELVISNLTNTSGKYSLALKPIEVYDRSMLQSLEFTLRSGSGVRIEEVGFSGEEFILQTPVALGNYRMTLQDKATGSIIGVVDIVPDIGESE